MISVRVTLRLSSLCQLFETYHETENVSHFVTTEPRADAQIELENDIEIPYKTTAFPTMSRSHDPTPV